MINKIKFKRISADTNIIIALALLYERGEREFIDANLAGDNTKFAQKQYAMDIKELQKNIDKHLVQIIITPKVLFELKYREPKFDPNGNPVVLTPQIIANHNLKDIALEYLARMPKIKIANIAHEDRMKFNKYSEQMAHEYVYTFHIFNQNDMNKPSNDAFIMAQSTALGCDLLTRDRHFKRKHYLSNYNNTEKISLSNNNLGGRRATVIDIANLESELTTTINGKVVTKHSFPENESIVNCEYLSYTEYLNKRKLERQARSEFLRKYKPAQGKQFQGKIKTYTHSPSL